METILILGITVILVLVALAPYLRLQRERTRRTEQKLKEAHEFGLHEPVSLHPKVDPATCIGTGACIIACPEKDILCFKDGKAVLVNASRCVGHGACAQACPVNAITLVFGTEKRGVDIPYITEYFETNVEGMYIVGELGGMGLIKNAITQGREAVAYITERLSRSSSNGVRDLVVVGAGPAGISASLAALEAKLNFVAVEQEEDLGGTVLHYPRNKIVMTSPAVLPMYGTVKLREVRKEALLELWHKVIKYTGLQIQMKEKVIDIKKEDDIFHVTTTKGIHQSKFVVLAIGRRGTPRKLGVPGEQLPKVTYRLLEPEQHQQQHLLVVGGGDSAVEAAIALCSQQGNTVTLSYRGNAFSRIKQKNKERIDELAAQNAVNILYNSNVKEITETHVRIDQQGNMIELPNDYVYIFAGGELPNEFLQKIGVRIEKKFGTR